MRHQSNFKTLAVAITTLSVASVAGAAGLERSGQDTTAFFQDGTYAEFNYAYVDADVTGKDENGTKIKDIAEDYDFFRFGVKTDINDTFSIGILYDEPWAASADYHGDNAFIAPPSNYANELIASQGLINPITGNQVTNVADFKEYIDIVGGSVGTPNGATEADVQRLRGLEGVLGGVLTDNTETQVEVRSESITGLLGMKLGENKEFQVYGGPVAQRLKAEVHLRGDAYDAGTAYDLEVNPDIDYGWIAGLQYSKPEIALKASLTYRSEIDYDVDAAEVFPLAALRGINPEQTTDMEATTPESVNLDFQTGINPTTLATARVRWVPWSDFAVKPPLYNGVTKAAGVYGPDGLNLIDYEDDQWLVELGLGKRVTPRLAVSGSLGWDSGSGDPTTSLGPIDGYYSVGAGAKYNFTDNWAVSAGGKYLWFGDADGQIPSGQVVSKFEDNDGFIVGVKLSYQEK